MSRVGGGRACPHDVIRSHTCKRGRGVCSTSPAGLRTAREDTSTVFPRSFDHLRSFDHPDFPAFLPINKFCLVLKICALRKSTRLPILVRPRLVRRSAV
jgi:hypothetical protein